jgi:hypothetical protein
MGQWGEPYKAENGDTLIDHYNTKAFEPIGKNSKVDSTFIINTETKKRVKMTKLPSTCKKCS